MKKTILLSVAVLFLASCKKDVICSCSLDTTKKSTNSTTTSDYKVVVNNQTEAQAKRGECSSYTKEDVDYKEVKSCNITY